MFAAAVSQAQRFTWPVILSTLYYDNSLESGIGSFVVVNDEGWIVTAAHVFGGLRTIPIHKKEIAAYEAGKLARKKVPGLRKNPKWVVDHSVWPGRDGVRLEGIVANFEIDLAIARLTPFESAWVGSYPSFKDPADGILPGTSLCRLGFPFHQFTPTYEKGTGFILPDGALPVPLFPIEGIMTRNVFAGLTTDRKREIKFIETSSPGLRGQSGGPLFDQAGRVWGIQSRTTHLPLGFSPPVPGRAKNEVEHQFLNVGWAVHPEVVQAFLKENGIKFNVA